MRRLLLTAALLLGACAGVLLAIGTIGDGPNDESMFATRFSEVLAPVIVESTQTFTHRFTVYNPERQAIRILDVQTGCACRTTEVPLRELKPGQEGSIEISATIGPPGGLIPLSCTVVTDSPIRPSLEYLAHLPVHPKRQIKPAQLAFGVIPVNSISSRTFEFQSYARAGESHERVESAQSPSLLVFQNGEPSEETLDGGIIRRTTAFIAQLRAASKVNTNWAMIDLKLAPPVSEAIQIGATWQIQPAIQVVPSNGAFFGKLPQRGELAERTVILKSAKELFRIVEVKRPELCPIEVEFNSGRALMHLVKLKLDLVQVRGTIHGTIVLELDHPDQLNAKVDYAASAE